MPWTTGDILGPTNLNAQGASATTSAGFSTNTISPESGNTVSFPVGVSIGSLGLLGPMYANNIIQFDTGLAAQIAQLEQIYRGPVGLVVSARGTMQFLCDNNANNTVSDKVFFVTSGSTEGGSAATRCFYARGDGVFVAGYSVNAAAIRPNYAFDSEESLGWYRSTASTIALSYGSFSLNQGRLISVRTAASLDSTSMVANELAFSITASGASLAIRSGSTIYYFSSSASTKA